MSDELDPQQIQAQNQRQNQASPTGGSDNPSSDDLELRQLAENTEQEDGPETDIAHERAGMQKPVENDR